MANPTRGFDAFTRIMPVDLAFVRDRRGWFIGLGVVFGLLGLLAVLLPPIGSFVTTMVLGWLLLIAGVAQGVHAWNNRRWAGSNWAFVSAALHIVAGLLVMAFPLTGTLALTLILGVYLVAEGVLKIIRAVQHREMHSWGFLLFDGLVSLGLGLLIALGWPSTAAWALGLLVGINLLIGGTSMVMIGLGAGAQARANV